MSDEVYCFENLIWSLEAVGTQRFYSKVDINSSRSGRIITGFEGRSYCEVFTSIKVNITQVCKSVTKLAAQVTLENYIAHCAARIFASHDDLSDEIKDTERYSKSCADT